MCVCLCVWKCQRGQEGGGVLGILFFAMHRTSLGNGRLVCEHIIAYMDGWMNA